jgi:hypothetical protein
MLKDFARRPPGSGQIASKRDHDGRVALIFFKDFHQ